jgi:protein-disulfide isomerase
MGLATVTVALALVHREFFPAQGKPVVRPNPVHVADWQTIVPAARTLGDPNAPVKVIEFADLQCPFCRDFNSRMKAVQAKYRNSVALVFVHFPLPFHPHAQPAARAAECASSQGRFEQMIDSLYAGQASYGNRSWATYAKAAGVEDSTAFASCMADTASPPLVQAGLAIGRRLKVTATPTVFVNDLRFGIPPTDSELDAAIVKALAANARR